MAECFYLDNQLFISGLIVQYISCEETDHIMHRRLVTDVLIQSKKG